MPGLRRLLRCAPTGRRCGFLLFLVAALAAPAAQATEPVVRVEEDFELVLATADVNSASPQVVCTMSPTGDLDCAYFTFQLNHQSVPEFVPGGLQVQAYHGQWVQEARKFPGSEVMSTAGEVVRWTQVLELVDGELHFEVVGGSSETWGSFGGQGYLKLSAPSHLEDLNGYRVSFTVDNSGVSYGGNRVSLLALRGVRLTFADGEVVGSNETRVIHELP